MRTFIIGYGSLLKKTSLNRTLPQVEKIEPVTLHNYLRSWNANENVTATLSTTYLGIQRKMDSRMNAIIFEIEKEFLSTLDKREFLYERVKVDYKDIEFFSSSFDIDSIDEVWIYITKEPHAPSKKSPIIQSYVDTCLSGAFEIEEKFKIVDFAKDFILTTQNWSNFWVNDRIYPRAPHIYQPDAYRIDSLLEDTIQSYYVNIEVE